jgi:cell division transport system permease protein
VVLLGILLASPGWLVHAMLSMDEMTPRATESSEVLVFLEETLELENRMILERRLGAYAQVSELIFVPRAQALSDLADNDGLSSIRDLVDDNPLPDAYRLRLIPDGASETEREVVAEVMPLPGVLSVRYFPSIQARLADVIGVLRGVVIALMILTAFGISMAVFVVSGAEAFRDDRRLQLYTLLGASRRYIRRPYLYRATVQGALAGLLASLVVWGINTVLSQAFSTELRSLGAPNEALMVRWEVWVALCGVAIGCSWIGAERAIALRLNRMH